MKLCVTDGEFWDWSALEVGWNNVYTNNSFLGYGQIYVARDQQTNESVAIKAEPTRRKNKLVRRMILEQRVLVRLQGQRKFFMIFTFYFYALAHVPIIYASGCERDINFIVMQILSVNLGDLRKQCPLQRLSKSTTARIAQQTIAVSIL